MEQDDEVSGGFWFYFWSEKTDREERWRSGVSSLTVCSYVVGFCRRFSAFHVVRTHMRRSHTVPGHHTPLHPARFSDQNGRRGRRGFHLFVALEQKIPHPLGSFARLAQVEPDFLHRFQARERSFRHGVSNTASGVRQRCVRSHRQDD